MGHEWLIIMRRYCLYLTKAFNSIVVGTFAFASSGSGLHHVGRHLMWQIHKCLNRLQWVLSFEIRTVLPLEICFAIVSPSALNLIGISPHSRCCHTCARSPRSLCHALRNAQHSPAGTLHQQANTQRHHALELPSAPEDSNDQAICWALWRLV